MLGGRRVGIEITPRAARVAVVRGLGRAIRVQRYAEASLAHDIFMPCWERENIRNEAAFSASIEEVFRAAGAAGAPAALALPDLTARLRILTSDTPPTDPGGLHRYAMWRLRDECPPLPARISPIFYLNGHPTGGYLAILVAAAATIGQIERVVRAAGAKPIHITSTAVALFNLLAGDLARPGKHRGTTGFLVAGDPSATLLLVSDSTPVFSRTFRHSWNDTCCSESITTICAEVGRSLDWCVNAGLHPAEQIMLTGECASAAGLAESLSECLGIPCHHANCLAGGGERAGFPPQGIGAIAAALS
jgi:Tfp pilus assembly PilM family ATPase